MTLHRRDKALGKVIWSENELADGLCVDVFERLDGTFGFEEYRRDVESLEGWFPIGFYSDKVFKSQEEAEIAARQTIAWLK